MNGAAPRAIDARLGAMQRWTQLATIGLLVIAIGFGGWMWRENRRLEDELARRPAAGAKDAWSAPAETPASAATDGDRSERGALAGLGRRIAAGGAAPPTLDLPKESRLERRLRRQEEMSKLLGREPGESEEDYKARVLPLVELALGKRRKELADMRRAAEEKAGVTEAQRAQMDAAFQNIYDEVVAYTDTAVTDGQLTPYERNVQGLLQYAGGLGSILEGAEGRIGSILSQDQLRTIYESGFEWGEYLGVSAPWERLRAPPPRPQ